MPELESEERLDANGIPIVGTPGDARCAICEGLGLCDCQSYLDAVRMTLSVFLGPDALKPEARVSLAVDDLEIMLARANKSARMHRQSADRNREFFSQNKKDTGALTESAQSRGRMLGIEWVTGALYTLMKSKGVVYQPIVHTAQEPEYISPTPSQKPKKARK